MSRPHLMRLPRLTSTVGLPVLAGALLLSGCAGGETASPAGSAGQAASRSSTAPPPPGMSLPGATRMLTDYDRRNNAAIRAAATPPYDEKPWSRADSGPALEDDIYDTRVRRADPPTSQPAAYALKHSGARVLGVARHRDRDIALIGGRITRSPQSPGDQPIDKVSIFGRSSGSSWLLWDSFSIKATALPQPLPAQVDPTPTPAQVTAAQPLVGQLIDSVRSEPGAALSAEPQLKQFLGQLWPGGKPHRDVSRTIQCEPYAARGSQNVADALQLVRATGARVAVVTVRCRVDYSAKGKTAIFFSKGAATVNRVSTEGAQQATTSQVISALVVQPDSGKPRLLGLSGRDVVPD